MHLTRLRIAAAHPSRIALRALAGSRLVPLPPTLIQQCSRARQARWSGAMASGEAGDGGALFDREQFRQRIAVQALRVPTKQCQHYMSLLSK